MGLSTVRILKIVIVALAIVTAILGCVSHFGSSWTKSLCLPSIYGGLCLHPYEICDIPGAEKCPKIGMERYFVAMVIICCILSAMFVVIDYDYMEQDKQKIMKTIDAVYHVIAAVLLIIAAIVYFISTEQIYDIFGVNKQEVGNIDFKRPEKLAAATLTLGQGLLCGVTAIFIFKS